VYEKILSSLIIGWLWLTGAASFAQTSERDSISSVLRNGQLSKVERIDLLIRLSELGETNGCENIDAAYKAALTLGDSSRIVATGKLLGFCRMDNNQHQQAIGLLIRTLGTAKRNGIDDQVRSILNSIGIAYGDIGLYDSALLYHFESLQLREKHGDQRAISVALNNIGIVHYKLENSNLALKYFLPALSIKEEIGDKSGYVRLLVNIGLCYNQLGENKEAIRYAEKALRGCEDDCVSIPIARSYYLIAIGKFYLGDLEESHKARNKSLKISSQINDRIGVIECEILEARLAAKKRDFTKAIRIAEEIVTNRSNKIYPELLSTALKVLIATYGELKDYDRKQYFQDIYIKLRDSIFGNQLTNKLATVQAQYEERVNLKKIREQAEILQLKEEIIQRQRQQTIFITIIACLGIALTYLLFRFSRELQRKRTDLSIKNKQLYEVQDALRKVNRELDQLVEERTKDLADINQSLASTNEELDYFIYKTSHDIRGPLASLLGLAHLGKLEVTEPVASNYLHQIDGTASKLNTVLSKMAKINQISRGELKPVSVDLEALLSSIVARQTAHLPPGKVDVSTTLDGEVRLVSDVALIETCLENLISNAIKYRSDSVRIQPFVKIQVEQKMHAVLIRVVDNGIGIPEMSQEQLFRMFVRASERSETGGIGLYLAKLSASRIFGKLSYSKNEQGHTVFTLLLHPNLEQRLAQVQQLRDEKAKQEAMIRARVQSLSDEVL
jgi:signal transduction histidine kinase